MFGFANNCKHENIDIVTYCNQESVQTSQYDKTKKSYTYRLKGQLHTSKGLTKFLKKNFYPHFKTPRRRFSKGKHNVKMASSRALGNQIDKQLYKVVIAGNIEKGKKRPNRTPTNLHPLTKEILHYWNVKGLTPVAAQLPTQIPSLNIMTQADVIVQDQDQNLYMHEIKTGYVGVNIEKGCFKHPYNKIKCTKQNIWDLQRYWTEKALIEQGLPLKGSTVIHAYEERDRKTKQKIAKVRPIPRVFK